MKDEFGQELTGQTEFHLALGPARPVMELIGRQGVLEESEDPAYPFRIRNVKQVKVRGLFLSPDTVVPFLVKHKLTEYSSQSTHDFLAGEPVGRIRSMSIDIKNPPNVMTYEPVRLKKLFTGLPGPGIMYIDLTAHEFKEKKTKNLVYQRAVVQVTNLGLSAKVGRSDTLIWTTDLEAGVPKSGVRLEIRNRQNKVLWRGISDSEGLARAPGADSLQLDPEDLKYGQPSFFILAFFQDEFAMLDTQWDGGISPWNFGLSAGDLSGADEVMTWVLTSLPMYKPGEEVEFKIIRRRSGPTGLEAPADKRIKVTIRDSRGKDLKELELEMGSFGTASGSFRLPETASLGYYGIQCGPVGGRMTWAGSFRVETYRKPTFTVSVDPSKTSGVPGDRIGVEVEATYHFGAPVKDRPARYVVTATPTDYTLPRFEAYTISDWYSDPEREYEPTPIVSEGTLDTDTRGRIKFDFQATAPKTPEPRDFSIETVVTDVDQRTVASRKQVLIHPADFYLGLKSENYLVRAGEKFEAELIAATPEGKLVEGVTTNLVLYRRTWQTVRRKGVGGYYHYLSKVQDTVVSKLEAATKGEPLTVSFEVDNSGFYYLSAGAADQAGRNTACSLGFYAYGSGSAGWEHYDHDRIDIIPDKKEYRPGEAATILVKSPFTNGSGILTVERNGVMRHQLFKIESAAPTLTVDLGPEDSPNVYVSVLLVRGRISETLDRQGRDPGKPAYRIGYTELNVKDDSNKLKVEVASDRPEYRPGEEVELKVSVSDHNGKRRRVETALVVADAALLQLTSDDVYYPERLFFSPRPLSVYSSDLRQKLVGRRHYGLKGAKPGGGGMGPGGPDFRRRFVSLALFKPHVVTDEDGQAIVRFKLPDNLTTFKVYAAANDEAAMFGTGTGEFMVTQPLLLTSALPNVAGVGDQLTAAVSVHNRTKDAGPLKVRLTGEGFEIKGDEVRTVEIGAEASMEVGFPILVKPGQTAIFRFEVAMGDNKDAAEYRVPIRFPNPIITTATYGRITASENLAVELPAGSDPARGGVNLTVSPSLAGALDGAFGYLKTYPYSCLEQKTSMAFGDLFSIHWKTRLGLSDKDEDAARKRIIGLLERLTGYQSYQGGYYFWPGGQDPDPFLSAYVCLFLSHIKDAGFTVDDNLYKQSLDYLANVVNHNKWPGWYSGQTKRTAASFLVYVLAEAGRPVAPLVESLYLKKDQASTFDLILLLKTLTITSQGNEGTKQIADLIKRILSRAVITSGEMHIEDANPQAGLMGSSVRTNAAALSALISAIPKSPLIVDLARWLTHERKNGHWGSTQSNAWALMAMADYLKVMEKDPPDLTVTALLDDKTLGQAVFKGFQSDPLKVGAPAEELTAGVQTPFKLDYQGRGAAYYSLHLEYAAAEPDLNPVDNGFTLTRTYTPAEVEEDQAKPATSFKRGDIVRVEVTILVPSQRHWVVVEDVLPAGLEPINFNLPVAPEYLQRFLEQGGKSGDYYSRYWYEHREVRSDRVVVFARYMGEGAYTLTYLARAVTEGEFLAPGPRAEEMYTPEVLGRGQGARFEVHNK